MSTITNKLLDTCDLGWFSIRPRALSGALCWVKETIDGNHRRYACFCEASLLSNVSTNPSVAKVLRGADEVFPDGIAMVLLARLMGHRLPARIPGPSFLPAACEYGVALGWRHFFYGGGPGVADRLAGIMSARYPGLKVVGTCAPPFRGLTSDELADVKRRIEDSKADILWVCLGSPKQELWVAENVGKIEVPLMMPVGAAFDFHAGERPWAPSWVRRIGMEWLFRTFTGGRRTFWRNVRCVTVVAWILLGTMVRVMFGKKPFPPKGALSEPVSKLVNRLLQTTCILAFV